MPFQLKPLDVIRLYLIIVNHILTEQHVSEGAVQTVDNGKISDLAILMVLWRCFMSPPGT